MSLCGNGGGVDGGPSVVEFGDGGDLTRGGIIGGRDGGDHEAPPFKYMLTK